MGGKAPAAAPPPVAPPPAAAPAAAAPAAAAKSGIVGSDVTPVLPDDPLRYRNYGGVQAYIAVNSTLVDTILKEGYRAQKRENVPCCFDPARGVKAVRSHVSGKEDRQTVLEVFGLDESLLDRSAGCIKGKHVPPENLKLGTFFTRDMTDYAGAPCPMCGNKIDDSQIEHRGNIGNFQFIKGAFMVVPCQNEACQQLQIERQTRLDAGHHVWLYHLTDEQSATLIKKAGGKMLRGSKGNVGGGIYLGLSAVDCCKKSLHGSDRSAGTLKPDGRLLKCRVKIGDVIDHDKCENKLTFGELIKQQKDCLWGTIGYQTKSYVVYSWDQVQVAARVDEADNVIED